MSIKYWNSFKVLYQTAKKMMSVGLIMYTLITITSAGQQFVASPSNLEIGLVKKLQIECTATKDNTIALTTQIRILFSNNTEQPVYDLLGLVDSVLGIDNSSEAVDSGEIVRNGTSKLRLTWNFPKHDRAGVYKCEVRGKNINGVQKINSLTVEVTAVVPDQVTIFDAFQKMSSDLENVKAESAKQERIQSELTDRLERGKSKFFRVSNPFQGRRYYLSANSNVLVAADADAMCEIFGGYLVEIDSAEEYQFIVTFLSNFTQYQLVLTGGKDEVLENNWVNTYSQTAVKYINWATGEPNEGRRANCLYFWMDSGLKMADYKCSSGINDIFSGYMCEIDE